MDNQSEGIGEQGWRSRLGVRERATVQGLTTKPGVWALIAKETKKFCQTLGFQDWLMGVGVKGLVS